MSTEAQGGSVVDIERAAALLEKYSPIIERVLALLEKHPELLVAVIRLIDRIRV